MTPAKDLQEYVDSFFIFPCCDLSDSLVYNDGTPMLAFLSEAEDEVELEYNEATSRFKSGWFSTRSFEKMAVRFSGKGTYLLIVRFKPASFYRLFGLDAKKLNTVLLEICNPVFQFGALAGRMQQCCGSRREDRLLEN